MNGQSALQSSTEGATLVLRLNRPDQRNALSYELINALSDAFSGLPSDQSIRSVVLTGEGKAFCSGMDLKETRAQDGTTSRSVTFLTAFSDLLTQIHRCRKPVIAAVNGDAIAGGAGLAMACDFVIADAVARFGFPEVRLGMVAAVVMRDLVNAVGDRKARELLLTGLPISAQDAEHFGLINRVAAHGDALTEAMELAASLRLAAPRAISTTKELLDEVQNRTGDLRGAAAVSAIVRESEEAQEGIAAFVEKRLPSWGLNS